MSVTRNLLLVAAATVATIGSASVFAGGADPMCAPAPAAQPYFYAELGAGYAMTNYLNFADSEASDSGISNANGGFSAGGDFGYHFAPNLAVELGGGMLPEAKGGGKVSSWYGYGALRMDASINNMDKLNLFMKGGVAYRDLHIDGTVQNDDGTSLTFSDSDNYVTYIFGAGASYDITSNIYVALEGDFIGGKDKNEDDKPFSPGASIYMMKLGYNFSF